MFVRALRDGFITIGEAVKTIPSEYTGEYPEVDWSGFAGMRDVGSHRYFNWNTDIATTSIQEELPTLRRAVVSIKENL
jgi:uncharacterized protein with HEPN domain